jgi:DNA-binding MarR family transcriptional regulator
MRHAIATLRGCQIECLSSYSLDETVKYSTRGVVHAKADQGPDQMVEEAAAALRELLLAGERYRRVASSKLRLSISESQAVSHLLAKGPMGQTELGEALGFNTSSITALVDRLERNTMAKRVPHPSDRRRSIVQLSESGLANVGAVRDSMSSAFDDITPDHLPELTAALRSLAANLHARTTIEQASADAPS